MEKLTLATDSHLVSVAEIERTVFHEPWSENALKIFLDDANFCAVCAHDDEVLSYCTVTSVLDEAQIVNIATAKNSLRRGYASQVLDFVISECKKRRINSISLEVRVSNNAAIALYESKGFSKEGIRRSFYSHPREDAYVMIKEIN